MEDTIPSSASEIGISSLAGLRRFRRRVLALLIGAALIPLLVISGWAWIVYGRIIRTATEQHLQTVVQDHAASIDLFLSERLMALSLITRMSGEEDLVWEGALCGVLAHLNASYENSYQDLGIIDDQGRHLAYCGPYDLLARNYRETVWFSRVRQEGSYISDVFLGFRMVPHIIMAVCRRREDGRFWILRATINSEKFDQLVSRGRMGRTGDCYVIDRQGRYQTPPKSGKALLEESGIVPAAASSGLITEMIGETSGRRVIRTMKWIKNGEWLVVAQQDLHEARSPVRAALYRGLALVGMGIVLILVTSFWATRVVFRLILQAQRQKEQADARLLQASKLAQVGELATGVAHEINNPLAIMVSEQTNISDLLAEIGGADPGTAEIAEAVRQTKKQIERCKVITQKMLQFGRQGGSMVRRVDPSDDLREIARLLQNQARMSRIDLCLEMEAPLSPVMIDPGELQQVLTNLVNNSIQAIGGNGGGILISVWRDKDLLCLDVEDTGPGIPGENLDRVFEPFFTTKPVGKGTGLGLSLCYGIVAGWGGRIHAHSGPGGGARFEMRLPVAV